MRNQLPQLIIMLSGAALIIIGVALVCLQFYHESQMQGLTPVMRGLTVDPRGTSSLQTTYVGLIVIAIGAVLEVVGILAARRSTPKRKHSAETETGNR